MRLRLNRLRAVGTDVAPAEIEFGGGLTVLSGASNTGKSYVAQCLYYMLGGQTPPKPVRGDGAYHTLLMEMSAESNTVPSPFTLQRGLRGGEVALHERSIDSWTPEGEHTVLAWKHSSKNDANLSRFLLRLCGLDGTTLQFRSTSTRMISFSDLKRFLLVNETAIIADTSPVYPTGQRQDKSLEKATFEFLISGQDATGVIVRPDVKVEKAKWRAQGELFDQLIAETTAQISAISAPDATQLAAAETRVAELIDANDQRSTAIIELNGIRREQWGTLKARQARFEAVEQLLFRFSLLKEHYTSDVNRLTFVAEGEFLLSQLSEVKCPLCHSQMSAPIDDAVPAATRAKTIQQSCLAERHKIERSIADLEITATVLREERRQLSDEIAAIQGRIREAERAINNELQPAIAASNKEMEQLNQVRQRAALAETLRDRLQSMENMKKALGPEPKSKRSPKGEAPTGSNLQQRGRRAFGDEIQRLLTNWRYPNAGVTEFNEQMDLVVNGESRFGQGKGHRAVLTAAFTISLMNVANGRHPQFVVIDSPLTSYKSADAYKVEEDLIRGFYESLIATPSEQQVIIIENYEPPADLIPRMRHIHFSGPAGPGRSGFYPPV
jgi:uncharacterized protein with PIN domain